MASRWPKRLVVVGAFGVVLALAAFGMRPVPVLGVDGSALTHSFGAGGGGGTGYSGGAGCSRLSSGDWRCFQYDARLSTSVAFRVHVDGMGCWEARAVQDRRYTPTGCLYLADYL